MLLFLSLNLTLNSVLEAPVIMSIFFLLNPSLSTNVSSLVNNELEQMSSAKDKPLQVYEQCTPRVNSDPTTVLISHVPVLDTQPGENPIVSPEHISFDHIHSDLDQPIALRKGK